MFRQFLVFLLFGLWVNSACVLGQQPDTSFYKSKTNQYDNRYEGEYDLLVGTPPFELISFTSYIENYKFYEREQNLHIMFFMPDPSRYCLVAQEVRIQNNYWMEPRPRCPKSNKGWVDRDDLLSVRGKLAFYEVDRYNLALSVRLNHPSSRIFSPAILYYSQIPTKVQSYQLDFRSGLNIDSCSFSLYKGKYEYGVVPSRKLILQKRNLVLRNFEEHLIHLEFSLPKDKYPKLEGWCTAILEIYPSDNGRPFPYRFMFFHTPEIQD